MKSKIKQTKVLVRFNDGTEKTFEAQGFDCSYSVTGNYLVVYTRPTNYVYQLADVTSFDYEYND